MTKLCTFLNSKDIESIIYYLSKITSALACRLESFKFTTQMIKVLLKIKRSFIFNQSMNNQRLNRRNTLLWIQICSPMHIKKIQKLNSMIAPLRICSSVNFILLIMIWKRRDDISVVELKIGESFFWTGQAGNALALWSSKENCSR